MWISKIELTSFRNYESIFLEFEKGVNYIKGSNASGKTSLVEAIAMLALFKSLRTSDEKEVIKIGHNFASIVAWIENSHQEKIKLVISEAGKYIENNDIEVKKISSILGVCKVISFIPKDVDLFKEVPLKRRKFIDYSISMLDKTYLKLLSEYNHYLNDLKVMLKNKIDYVYLEILVDELAKRGIIIQKKRQEFINGINEEINDVGKAILLEDTSLLVKYHPSVKEENLQDYKNKILSSLKNGIQDNLSRIKILGIHNDDISLDLNNLDLATYASQGQNRLGVICLKLSLFELIKKKYHQEVIVIFDDVLSELDNRHQDNLINYLNRIEQVFITGTQEQIKGNYTVYSVSNNQVRRI